MGIQSTVWSNDTITVEVIVRSRILAVVATVSEDGATCDGALVTHALIHEVPDISTLIFGVLTNEIPVLLEATH